MLRRVPHTGAELNLPRPKEEPPPTPPKEGRASREWLFAYVQTRLRYLITMRLRLQQAAEAAENNINKEPPHGKRHARNTSRKALPSFGGAGGGTNSSNKQHKTRSPHAPSAAPGTQPARRSPPSEGPGEVTTTPTNNIKQGAPTHQAPRQEHTPQGAPLLRRGRGRYQQQQQTT